MLSNSPLPNRSEGPRPGHKIGDVAASDSRAALENGHVVVTNFSVGYSRHPRGTRELAGATIPTSFTLGPRRAFKIRGRCRPRSPTPPSGSQLRLPTPGFQPHRRTSRGLRRPAQSTGNGDRFWGGESQLRRRTNPPARASRRRSPNQPPKAVIPARCLQGVVV